MKIVYFDGYCNVCNRFVDFLIRRDKRMALHYAPLQGPTAERRLSPDLTSSILSTMVFEQDGEIYVESSAAIRTIMSLGGLYAFMGLFLIVPPFIRDAVYRWIANHRYLWFGRRDSCRIASAEERERFLD